ILAASTPRPVRFVMYHRIFDIPVLRWIFRTARAIPIAPEKEDPELMQRAFDEIDHTLVEGGLVAIFPEGRLTADGEIAPFRRGIERIVERAAERGQEIPVVPMALRNMWSSMWSRRGSSAEAGRPGRMRLPRRLRARIDVVAGPPVVGADASAASLEARVRNLRGDQA
ncbi:MAG: 1-acyl-sn-glycerol-3-phosphate acyltransferase, partial [Luteimonas sp.]